MPWKTTVKRARKDKRQGKAPTTQAGEFVREQMEKLERGTGRPKSRKQAIAIGLSEARRSGVKLGPPPDETTGSKRRAAAKKRTSGRKAATKAASRSRKKPR